MASDEILTAGIRRSDTPVPGRPAERNRSATSAIVKYQRHLRAGAGSRAALTGSCDAVGRLGTYTLCTNLPQVWNGPRIGQPAMWSCGWCSDVGGVNLQGAKAWICCVRP